MPNYICVSDKSLGNPPSLSAAVMRWLWEVADRNTCGDVHDGALLICGSDDFLPARALTWAGVAADVLYLHMGDKELKDVEVGLQAGLVQPGPPDATRHLEQQVAAIWDMTPTWVPVEDEEFVLRRVEELLEVLELGSCADRCIGDSTVGSRGLSGGQRRRVTSESPRSPPGARAASVRHALSGMSELRCHVLLGGSSCAVCGLVEGRCHLTACFGSRLLIPPPHPHSPVGIELVKDPSLMLLDEPLSGGLGWQAAGWLLCVGWGVGPFAHPASRQPSCRPS